MYEVLDDTAAQVLLTIESGDSIRRVAQHLHLPYETVRQTVNRLEDAGYVQYDDGLSVVNARVRDAARELVATSASVSLPSIEEAYVIPQFGEWPFAFTRIDAVYVWTRGGYQLSRDPDDYPLFLAVREQDVDAWERFFASFGIPTVFERRKWARLSPDRGAVVVQLPVRPQPTGGHRRDGNDDGQSHRWGGPRSGKTPQRPRNRSSGCPGGRRRDRTQSCHIPPMARGRGCAASIT